MIVPRQAIVVRQKACRTRSPFHQDDFASEKLLVVEDCLDAAEALAAQLKQWGYECRICTSGDETLALAPYFKPRVVLIDIGLPDMDVWELALRLPPDALLVAVTARGDAVDFQR